MSARPSLDDYIDVAERIAAFAEKYPEGSLQTIDWSVADVAGKPFIVYRAAAFRHPDDTRPGHGIAWEPFPGTTPYTKNSELMNAETAAWGRAIVALGLAANRKLASRQEVKARMDEQAPTPATALNNPDPDGGQAITEDTLAELRKVYAATKPASADFRAMLAEVGVADADKGDLATLMGRITEDQATWVVLKLRGSDG